MISCTPHCISLYSVLPPTRIDTLAAARIWHGQPSDTDRTTTPFSEERSRRPPKLPAVGGPSRFGYQLDTLPTSNTVQEEVHLETFDCCAEKTLGTVALTVVCREILGGRLCIEIAFSVPFDSGGKVEYLLPLSTFDAASTVRAKMEAIFALTREPVFVERMELPNALELCAIRLREIGAFPESKEPLTRPLFIRQLEDLILDGSLIARIERSGITTHASLEDGRLLEVKEKGLQVLSNEELLILAQSPRYLRFIERRTRSDDSLHDGVAATWVIAILRQYGVYEDAKHDLQTAA